MSTILIPLLAGALALGAGADEVPAPAAPAIEGLGPALADATLQSMRGGQSFELTVVEANNDGTVDGNTAVGTLGAGNVVTGGAFGNAAGINTVIQNSGANVLIQNGTSVNVRFGAGGP